MSTDAHIEVVLDYFAGCNTGEIEHLLRTLDDDVVHYFLPAVHPPIRGARPISPTTGGSSRRSTTRLGKSTT